MLKKLLDIIPGFGGRVVIKDRRKKERRKEDSALPQGQTDQRRMQRRTAQRRGYFEDLFQSFVNFQADNESVSEAYDLKNYFSRREHHNSDKLRKSSGSDEESQRDQEDS